MFEWMYQWFDEGADAGGADGSDQQEAVELNDLDRKFLAANGIDPDKITNDPAEALKALQVTLSKGTEAQKQRAEAEKALKAMKADQRRAAEKLPKTILGADGQVNQEALETIESAAKSYAGMRQIADIMHDNGFIDEQAYDMLLDEDPQALMRAIKYGTIKKKDDTAQGDTASDDRLADLEKILAGAGLLPDQGGQTPGPQQQGQLPPAGSFGGLQPNETVFSKMLEDKAKRQQGRGR